MTSRAIALLAIAVVLLCGFAVGSSRTRTEFALRFETFPTESGNYALASTETLKTTISGTGKPEFTYDMTFEGENTNYAVWQSYLVRQAGNIWSEAGNITFSEGNTVLFHSNGPSGIQQGNFSDLQYGAITYVITGGTGLFQDCYGTMVDTFVTLNPLDPSAPFEINAWGILWQDE